MAIGTIPENLFVGRTDILEHLDKALQRATDGRGQLHMLVGEPGIGKTRLAEQVCEAAKKRGMEVLWGRCQEDAATPPYWPWEQAIRPWLEQLNPKKRAAFLGGSASLVAVAFPVVSQLVPGLKPFTTVPDKPEQISHRLYDAIWSFLARASAEKPMLIVLDDLHWADEGTLKLLSYTASWLGKSPVMILGTYRDVEVRRKHPLAGVLAELTRGRLFERHSLKGLCESEVESFCTAALPSPKAPAIARDVYARTEGNPLFVSEIVRMLTAEGTGPDDRASIRLPDGIKETIGRRLDRLSTMCNRVLVAASVLAWSSGSRRSPG